MGAVLRLQMDTDKSLMILSLSLSLNACFESFEISSVGAFDLRLYHKTSWQEHCGSNTPKTLQ